LSKNRLNTCFTHTYILNGELEEKKTQKGRYKQTQYVVLMENRKAIYKKKTRKKNQLKKMLQNTSVLVIILSSKETVEKFA